MFIYICIYQAKDISFFGTSFFVLGVILMIDQHRLK